MYKYFYLTMLISAILLCITALTSVGKWKKHAKIWGYIFCGLAAITIGSLIGFAVTIP